MPSIKKMKAAQRLNSIAGAIEGVQAMGNGKTPKSPMPMKKPMGGRRRGMTPYNEQ